MPGDSIYAWVSSSGCTSAFYTIYVPVIYDADAGLPPTSVQIALPPNTTFCPGAPSALMATGAEFGANPVYQWSLNGVAIGTDSSGVSGTWNSGDTLQCNIIRSGCNMTDTIGGSLVMQTGINNPSVTAYCYSVGNCTSPAGYSCSTSGLTGPLTYTWYHNDSVISNSVNISYPRQTQTLQNDTFTCQVISSAGCIGPLSSTVIQPPLQADTSTHLRIREGFSTYTSCPGDWAQFVTVNWGDSVYWYKNGVMVQASSGGWEYQSHTDSSDYTVFATNNVASCFGPDTSNTIFIHIVPPGIMPTLQITPDPAVFCGDNVIFTAHSNCGALWEISVGYLQRCFFFRDEDSTFAPLAELPCL